MQLSRRVTPGARFIFKKNTHEQNVEMNKDKRQKTKATYLRHLSIIMKQKLFFNRTNLRSSKVERGMIHLIKL